MAYLGKTPSQAVRSRYFYTATGGETSLSGADNNGDTLIFADGNYVDVYLNGVLLVAGTDYNVNTTNTIAGLAALTASDIVEIVVYDTFSVFGGTFQGALTADSINANIFGSHQFTARNVQGSTILKGTPVYIAGHSGNDPEIAIADADVTAKMPAFGIAATDIANNTKGNVVVFGNYIGIDTSAFAVGDELYVSNTGTLTTTRPSGSADKVQKIAKVIRSQSQNGQIFVMGAGRSNDTPNAITTNSINLSSSTTVSSVLDEDAMTSDSATALATQQSIKAYVDNQIGSNNELSEILTNGNTTGGNNIAFGDNDKAIFGAGSDLQIYHSGNDSYILDSGTGDLYLAGENSVRITSNTGLEAMATLTANGAVTLYHDNSAKLATTSTGVDVTGTVTASGNVTSKGGQLRINDGTTALAGGMFTHKEITGSGTNNDTVIFAETGNKIRFATNGSVSDKVIIDTAGNLLVGQSTTALPGLGNTTTGISLAGNHDIIAASRTSGASVLVNRNTDDGSLIEFSRNGSTVGSIGTNENTDLYIAGGDTGLLFNDGVDFICPATATGAGRDNAIDLGYSTVRFKDFYLSGGVYLGGTAAANKLDDYEEGTWTPTFQASSDPTVTYSGRAGYYTKVGSLVTVWCSVSTNSVSGGSGSLRITGLPFTEITRNTGYVVAGTWSVDHPMSVRVVGGAAFLYSRTGFAQSDLVNNIQVSDMSSASGGYNGTEFTVSYRVS